MENERIFYNKSMYHLDASIYSRFNELLNMAPYFEKICHEGEYLLQGFVHLAGDIWVSFYESKLKVLENHNVSTMHEDFIKHFYTLDEFNAWHTLTNMDPLLSVLTTTMICEKLVTQLKNDAQVKKEALQRKISQRKIEHAEQKMAGMNTEDPSDFEQTQNKFLQQSSQKMVAYAEEEIAASHTHAERVLQKFSFTMHQTLKGETRTIEKQKAAIVALSTIDGKKMEHVPLKDQFEIAEQLATHEILQLVAEMTGRFKKIAKKKMKTPSKMTMERKNITIGSELSRTIPLELANYMLPQGRADFLRRYAESQTFIFDKKGKESKGKGPIIICMDESSSMMTIRAESKAFCLALLMIARRQKRDFAIIPFSSNIGSPQIFKKGKSTAQMITTFSSSFLGGGTNYEKPLRESLNILSKSQFNEADVLFVTDGSSFLPSSFIEEFTAIKKKRKFECTAIVLTNLINTVDLSIVERFSDHVIEVKNLFEADTVFALH